MYHEYTQNATQHSSVKVPYKRWWNYWG